MMHARSGFPLQNAGFPKIPFACLATALCLHGGCVPKSAEETESAAHSAALLAESFALYTISPGAHSATISGATSGNPISWFSTVEGRDYRFRFNPSSQYVITKPTQPEDQLDWNKLPGFSDCGTLDLAVNGAMFGWRWRTDLVPQVLEVTAYANNSSKHLWSAMPLFSLDAADLASETPLRYKVWIDGALYRFAITGTIRGRVISAETTLPRACPATSPTNLKWASGLYFGGTSTAPTKITGHIAETAWKP